MQESPLLLLRQAVQSIQASISNQLPIGDKTTIAEFTQKVEALQEAIFAVSSTLQHNPNELKTWLELLNSSIEQLTDYKQCYRRLILSKKQEWAPLPIEGTLAKIYGTAGRLILMLLSTKFYSSSLDVEDLLCNSLALSEVEYIGEIQYFNNTEVLLSQMSTLLLDLKDIESSSVYIRILTAFLRAAYISGLSHTAAAVMQATDPMSLIKLIEESSIDYSVITDFVKYSAFNLVALSVMGDHIDDSLNSMADHFFRVLLNLPNLKLLIFHKYHFNEEPAEASAWPEPVSSRDPAFVADDPLVRRQEISFMYIINYLLSLTDILQLADPDGYYTDELGFLLMSLSWRNTKDIRSASRSGSIHSEVLLFREQNENKYDQAAVLAIASHHNLSSIILHGTYSQINLMVCQAFNDLKKPNLNIPKVLRTYTLASESDLEYSVSLIDADKFPGKIAYASVLDKILRLLHLLSLKFLLERTGFEGMPSDFIDSFPLTETDTSVKPSLIASAKESTKSSSADLDYHRQRLHELSKSVQLLEETSNKLDI